MAGAIREPARRRRIVGIVATALALAAIARATLPAGGPRIAPMQPWYCLVCGSAGGVDVLLNIVLFVPLGIGLALSGLTVRRSVVIAFLASAFAESWQYLVVTGRDPTISDLLTNTTGGAIGALLCATSAAWLWPTRGRATALVLTAAAAVCTVLVATAVGLQPSIAPRLYFAQIEPRPTNPAVFSGELLAASLNGRPITREGELQTSDGIPVPVIVDGRAQLDAAFTPGPDLVRSAPILRITNSRWEAVALVQERDRLVFRGRTRAVDARLIAPGLAVRGVLPASPRPSFDTVRVHAVVVRSGLFMEVARRGMVARYSLPFRIALGWTVASPYFTVDERFVPWLSALWLAALLAPIGYWSDSASRMPRIIAVVIIATMLAALPAAAGLSGTSLVEWLAAIAGYVTGVFLARTASRGDPAGNPREVHAARHP